MHRPTLRVATFADTAQCRCGQRYGSAGRICDGDAALCLPISSSSVGSADSALGHERLNMLLRMRASGHRHICVAVRVVRVKGPG